MAELMIIPAIIWGLLVGLYELFAIHADESFVGMRWFTHALQSAGFAMFFVFIVMNVHWALSFFPALENIIWLSFFKYLPVRAIIGIIAMFKIQTASMVVRGGRLAARGIGEHFSHTIIAGLLIIFSPEIMGFIWPYIRGFLSWA
ncbi:hypothetical protein B6U80_01355 [Candidatus Pacearchaeota archaeon ex4484_26]|nr:MAG: hypothetical protein B6U80_01355 [Candidatus Pacearchaeota archaeon ex4484_26]